MTKPSALDKMLKNHLPTCSLRYSGGDQRHCSCGHDEAVTIIEVIKATLGIYANPRNWESNDGYLYLKTYNHPWIDAEVTLKALQK